MDGRGKERLSIASRPWQPGENISAMQLLWGLRFQRTSHFSEPHISVYLPPSCFQLRDESAESILRTLVRFSEENIKGSKLCTTSGKRKLLPPHKSAFLSLFHNFSLMISASLNVSSCLDVADLTCIEAGWVASQHTWWQPKNSYHVMPFPVVLWSQPDCIWWGVLKHLHLWRRFWAKGTGGPWILCLQWSSPAWAGGLQGTSTGSAKGLQKA